MSQIPPFRRSLITAGLLIASGLPALPAVADSTLRG